MAEPETKTEEQVEDAAVPAVAEAESRLSDRPAVSHLLSHDVKGRSGQGYRLSQRLFVLAGLVLSLFSVYETFSNQPVASPSLTPRSFDAVKVPVLADGASLAETIDMFERRRIFGPPPPDGPGSGEEPVPVRGWRTEVRENWDLKGTSVVPGNEGEQILEAIVFDKRSESLQFLRAGQRAQILDKDVQVARIDADRVELRLGEEVLVLD